MTTQELRPLQREPETPTLHGRVGTRCTFLRRSESAVLTVRWRGHCGRSWKWLPSVQSVRVSSALPHPHPPCRECLVARWKGSGSSRYRNALFKPTRYSAEDAISEAVADWLTVFTCISLSCELSIGAFKLWLCVS